MLCSYVALLHDLHSMICLEARLMPWQDVNISIDFLFWDCSGIVPASMFWLLLLLHMPSGYSITIETVWNFSSFFLPLIKYKHFTVANIWKSSQDFLGTKDSKVVLQSFFLVFLWDYATCPRLHWWHPKHIPPVAAALSPRRHSSTLKS